MARPRSAWRVVESWRVCVWEQVQDDGYAANPALMGPTGWVAIGPRFLGLNGEEVVRLVWHPTRAKARAYAREMNGGAV